jgi:glycosyltransferase involved in cell wall biosynthesis
MNHEKSRQLLMQYLLSRRLIKRAENICLLMHTKISRKKGFSLSKILIVCLVKNEAERIECFIDGNEFAGWDFIFIDDFSTDETVVKLIQREMTFYKNSFKSFADQRNYAVSKVHASVSDVNAILFLDADEVLTQDLYLEITEFVNSDTDGFLAIPPLNIMHDVPVPRSSGFPNYHDRLFKFPVLGSFRTTHGGHIENFFSTSINYRKHFSNYFYKHYFYEKGSNFWLKKHVDLAFREAASENEFADFSIRHNLLIFFRKFKISPMLRFLYHFILKFGFLEGRAGFLYAYNYFVFEHFILIARTYKKFKKK